MYIVKELVPWFSDVVETVCHDGGLGLSHSSKMQSLAEEALRRFPGSRYSAQEICTRHARRSIVNAGIPDEMEAAEMEFAKLWTIYWETRKVTSLMTIDIRNQNIPDRLQKLFLKESYGKFLNFVDSRQEREKYFIRLLYKFENISFVNIIWGYLFCSSVVNSAFNISYKEKELADFSLPKISLIPYYQIKCEDGYIIDKSLSEFANDTIKTLKVLFEKYVEYFPIILK